MRKLRLSQESRGPVLRRLKLKMVAYLASQPTKKNYNHTNQVLHQRTEPEGEGRVGVTTAT